MKTIRYLFISMFCLITGIASAQTKDMIKVNINDYIAGKSIIMDVQFNNAPSSNYTAFQMDIDIPHGFVYVDQSIETGIRLLTHVVSSASVSENKLRITALSTQNMEISGTGGSLFSVILEAKETTPSGLYQVGTSGTTFVKRNGEEFYLDNTNTNFQYTAEADSVPYNLIFMVDGKEFKRMSLKVGERIPSIIPPQKEGHRFIGWKDLPKYMQKGDLVVTAEFAVNKYTITYILNDEVYGKQIVTYGQPIVPMEVKTADNEQFLGWEALPETMPASNLFIHGKTVITGIEELTTSGKYNIYNLQGVCILKNITIQEAKDRLAQGIYIINGKRFYIK